MSRRNENHHMGVDMTAGLDLGAGHDWAYSRGADERFRGLAQYMGNLALAEFLELATAVQNQAEDQKLARRWEDGVRVLTRLAPSAVRMVLTHPVSIFWIRSTRDLLSATLRGGPTPPNITGHLEFADRSTASYLERSLDLISELLLASYMVAGEETELSLLAKQVLCLPGTSFSARLPEVAYGTTLTASVRRNGEDFCLQLLGPQGFDLNCRFLRSHGRVGPIGDGSDRVEHWLPIVATAAGVLEIDNRDPRIVRNWVSPAAYSNVDRISSAPDSELLGWPDRLERALGLLRECCPAVESEFGMMMRTAVPVHGHVPEHGISCSNRDFWGAMQCSDHPGIAMAEVLAHEYRHNLLNALLEADTILTAKPGEALCYSPWRPDPRPPLGVLHGIFAFTEVAAFNLAYIYCFGNKAAEYDAAEYRALYHAKRLEVALVELHAATQFTSFGEELMNGLTNRIDRIVSDAAALNPGLWESAGAENARHYFDWQQRNGRKARGAW